MKAWEARLLKPSEASLGALEALWHHSHTIRNRNRSEGLSDRLYVGTTLCDYFAIAIR